MAKSGVLTSSHTKGLTRLQLWDTQEDLSSVMGLAERHSAVGGDLYGLVYRFKLGKVDIDLEEGVLHLA